MNANLMTKKIEMSKSEAKEAGKLNTEKFHELRQFMAAYPGYEVQIKAPSKRNDFSRSQSSKGNYRQSPSRFDFAAKRGCFHLRLSHGIQIDAGCARGI